MIFEIFSGKKLTKFKEKKSIFFYMVKKGSQKYRTAFLKNYSHI
jgi:hypothetical protein